MTTRPWGSPGGGWYTKKLNATSLREKFSKCRMLGKKCQFQKHVFFANWAILSKKKLRKKTFFHKIFCLPELVWSGGPLRNSLLRVSEVQGSVPLRGSSFLNLVWLIETGCEINWHFEFIYKVCSTHSTLGKATAPASTSQHQWPPRSSTRQQQHHHHHHYHAAIQSIAERTCVSTPRLIPATTVDMLS